MIINIFLLRAADRLQLGEEMHKFGSAFHNIVSVKSVLKNLWRTFSHCCPHSACCVKTLIAWSSRVCVCVCIWHICRFVLINDHTSALFVHSLTNSNVCSAAVVFLSEGQSMTCCQVVITVVLVLILLPTFVCLSVCACFCVCETHRTSVFPAEAGLTPLLLLNLWGSPPCNHSVWCR